MAPAYASGSAFVRQKMVSKIRRNDMAAGVLTALLDSTDHPWTEHYAGRQAETQIPVNSTCMTRINVNVHQIVIYLVPCRSIDENFSNFRHHHPSNLAINLSPGKQGTFSSQTKQQITPQQCMQSHVEGRLASRIHSSRSILKHHPSAV